MSLSYLEAVVVGALQGITELFPVSSLGHSVILPAVIGGQWATDLDVSSPRIAVPRVHRWSARGHSRGFAGVLLAGLGADRRRVLLLDPLPPGQRPTASGWRG